MKINPRRAHLTFNAPDRRAYALLFIYLARTVGRASIRRDLAAQLRGLANTIEEDAE